MVILNKLVVLVVPGLNFQSVAAVCVNITYEELDFTIK